MPLDTSRGLACRSFEGKKCMYKNDSWKYVPWKPLWMDLYQIWYSGSSRQPNHPW